jgi:serine/threonine protein kinase
VAVKLADIRDQVAFDRELQVYKRLSLHPHPNLCRMLSHQVTGDVAVLIFNSALADLREFISAGQLTVDVLPIASLHLACGLAALHSHNVVHRDLKPNNILVNVSAKGPIFQIADFGIARVVQILDSKPAVADMTPGVEENLMISRNHSVFGCVQCFHVWCKFLFEELLFFGGFEAS